MFTKMLEAFVSVSVEYSRGDCQNRINMSKNILFSSLVYQQAKFGYGW